MKTNLQDLLTADGIHDILDFTMIPFGNAYYNISQCKNAGNTSLRWSTGYLTTARRCWDDFCKQNPGDACFDGPIQCQHGPNECLVDELEGCAFAQQPDPVINMPFVYCFEGVKVAAMSGGGRNVSNQTIFAAANECATSLGFNYTALKECVDGGQGKSIVRANARRTFLLNPEHLYTPWVTMGIGTDIENGAPLIFPSDPESRYNPLEHLLEWVCGNSTRTPKPPGCTR